MVAISQPTNRIARDFTTLYTPPAIAGDFAGKHIVTVEQFERADLERIFEAAFRIRERVRRNDLSLLNIAAGRVMATLFYEASTRTDMSFQAAMLRLGGEVIATSGGVQFSSVYKGENLGDTVRAVGCYADVVVLRHPDVGSSFEAAFYLDQLGQQLGRPPVIISPAPPSFTQAASRLRECCGSMRASAWSRRNPAQSAGTVRSRSRWGEAFAL